MAVKLVICPKCGEKKVATGKNGFRHCGHIWSIEENIIQRGGFNAGKPARAGSGQPDGTTPREQGGNKDKQVSKQTDSGDRDQTKELKIETERKNTQVSKKSYKCAGCKETFKFEPSNVPDSCPNCELEW